MKKKIIITVVLLLVALVATYFFIFVNKNSDNRADEEASTKSLTPDDDINYRPPTESELNNTESIKDGSINDKPVNPETIEPVISTWGDGENANSFEISGFVPSVIESDGTCTVILEEGSFKLSHERKGYPNAQDTVCGPISFNKSELPKSFSAKLEYSSKKFSGVSAPVRIDL